MRRQVQIHARWARRRQRPRDSRPLPLPARPYHHHGTYLGAFRSLAAVAAHVLKDSPLRHLSPQDLHEAGITLHISGRVWTIAAGGMLHAFLASDPPADDAVKPAAEE